jgi:hypothetical protein
VRAVVHGSGRAMDLDALRVALADGRGLADDLDDRDAREAQAYLQEAVAFLQTAERHLSALQVRTPGRKGGSVLTMSLHAPPPHTTHHTPHTTHHTPHTQDATQSLVRTAAAAKEHLGADGASTHGVRQQLRREIDAVQQAQATPLGQRFAAGGPGARHRLAEAAAMAESDAVDVLAKLEAASQAAENAAAQQAQPQNQEQLQQQHHHHEQQPPQVPRAAGADGAGQMLDRAEAKAQQAPLPADVAHYLAGLEDQLRRFGESDGSVKTMLAATSVAQRLMRAGAALGGDAFSAVLVRLLTAALRGACASKSASHITTLANVLVGMFSVLPAGGHGDTQSLRHKGYGLFKAMLHRESDLCVPDLWRTPTGDDTPERRNQRLNCAELWGALVGTQSKASPLSEEDGWTWLVKAGKQLHTAMHRRKVAAAAGGGGGGSSSSGSGGLSAAQLAHVEQECCSALYVVLRQCCPAMVSRLGWTNVRDALQALQRVLNDDSVQVH